ncbi:MAG: DUF4123 domain-containing protein [Paracoccus sp. (in: a-proteobacteria)]|nr:DUF4123 domain-containing protein [Paracoccus sp. (in: a-proteobacteria)]
MSRTEINIGAPLDDQFGRHPRQTLPDALQGRLFAPGAGVFAVIDAARIEGFDAELIAQHQPHACLFGGEAVETLGASAPWLIQLDPDARLTRLLFTHGRGGAGYWGRDWGILIRSGAGFDALRAHLRRFTQIADAGGKRYFLRFYCPHAAPALLDRLEGDPARQRRWFVHRDTRVIDSIWIPDAGRARVIVHDYDDPGTDGHPQPRFMLDDFYHAALQEGRLIRMRERISRAVLVSEGNAAGRSTQDWHANVNAGLDAALRAGTEPERALAYVALAGLRRGTPLSAAEVAHALGLPGASPGEQTQRARHLAEAAQARPIITDDIHSDIWTDR